MMDDEMVDVGNCDMEKEHYDRVANCEHEFKTMEEGCGIVSIVCPKCMGFWTINAEPATEIWTPEQLAWKKEGDSARLKEELQRQKDQEKKIKKKGEDSLKAWVAEKEG